MNDNPELTRKEELLAMDYTSPEADEIIDIEQGRLKPEDAELVNYTSSDRPITLKPYPADDEEKTPKQRANESILYHDAVQAMKKRRAKMWPSALEEHTP